MFTFSLLYHDIQYAADRTINDKYLLLSRKNLTENFKNLVFVTALVTLVTMCLSISHWIMEVQITLLKGTKIELEVASGALKPFEMPKKPIARLYRVATAFENKRTK